MPSVKAITKWWCSADGQARIRQINDEHGINLGASLGSIDPDSDGCWACDLATSSLERCHVIPRSLGGSYDPSNLVLMCSGCHADNPDTADELSFWWWFDRVENRIAGLIRTLTDVIPSDITDKDGVRILSMVNHICESGQVASVGGRVSTGSLQAITHQAVRESKAKGECTGGKTPLGWKVDEYGQEIPDEDEQELISIVRDYRAMGISYSAIADKLTAAEFTSRTGKAKFSESMAKRINKA